MVDQLPEGWNLPTYMTLIIQLANLGPAIYTIYNKCHNRRQQHNHEVILCFVILLTSITSCLLTSVFWSTTVTIGDCIISLPVFILLSFSSLASCTSSLLFLPFMSRFESQYMFAYYFGQGLSGLVPGVLGLLQGLGGNPTCVNVTNITTMNPFAQPQIELPTVISLKPVFPQPNFSVKVFFLISSVFLMTSIIAFSILNISKMWLSASGSGLVIVEDQRNIQDTPCTTSDSQEKTDGNSTLLETDGDTDPSPILPQEPTSNKATLAFYLVIVFLLNMSINSIIPATQSYTTLSYGNTVYTLTVRLSSLFNSVFSLISIFIPKPTFPILATLTTTALSILIFHLVLAGLSPNPPFTNTIYGPVLIVSLIIVSCFISFRSLNTIDNLFIFISNLYHNKKIYSFFFNSSTPKNSWLLFTTCFSKSR